MLRVGFSLLLATSIILSLQVNAKEQLFAPLPEAKIDKKVERHFTPFALITAVSKSAITTEDVSGKLTRISYKIPVSYEPSHLINNYKKQVVDLGGSLIFECHHADCGRVNKLMKQLKPLNNIAKNSPALLSAKIPLDKKLLYVSVFAVNWEKEASLQLDIIEVIPEPLDLIAVNSSYLGTEIVQKTFEDMSHKDIKNASDHPLIDRLPGAYIQHYQQFDFGQTHVFTSVKNGQHKVEQIEGKITDINYKLPRTYSEFEVNANYKAALLKLGFVETFSCQGVACGKPRHIEKRTKTLAHIGNENHQFYNLYLLDRPEGNVHAMTYTIGFEGGLWSEIKLIEETLLVDDRVSIDLDGLTDKMAETGHVALDGLLFKFDSDQILPEAKSVVEVVATYLKSHPKQGFYVIGHTDDKGKQSYNQVLSDKRAKAVVKLLVSEYQVPKTQLTPKGIGEYSPVANNSNEAGQKLNRRVELVLRSDKL
jgi:outer membrane protein OmpA-like peptidoglycan-associated protein